MFFVVFFYVDMLNLNYFLVVLCYEEMIKVELLNLFCILYSVVLFKEMDCFFDILIGKKFVFFVFVLCLRIIFKESNFLELFKGVNENLDFL